MKTPQNTPKTPPQSTIEVQETSKTPAPMGTKKINTPKNPPQSVIDVQNTPETQTQSAETPQQPQKTPSRTSKTPAKSAIRENQIPKTPPQSTIDVQNTPETQAQSAETPQPPQETPQRKNKIDKIKLHELTIEALFQAYYDCRKRKRNTMQSMKFEFELEKNLFKLFDDLKNGTYEIGKSICFIVTVPKPREVWAGAFRDRIVHHLIYNAVKERFENRFIRDSFSCIPKRGTLAGSKRAAKFARSITDNYTKKAYFMKADISNYFNSIDKHILVKIIERYVKEKWLMDLTRQVIYHDPKTNVFIKSDKKLWEKLPAHKSMFNNTSTKGIPIGNLTSQFFSNVYLNELDQYVKHALKIKYYCRYVDDVLLFHEDPKYLNYCYEKMDEFLQKNLELHLNPKKKNMNLVCRGFDFVGHVIKPNRTLLRTTIIKNSFRTINEWKKKPNRFSDDELLIFRNKINSYLGMFKHVNGYRLRKKICEKAVTLFTKPDETYSKIEIVKQQDPETAAPRTQNPRREGQNPRQHKV